MIVQERYDQPRLIPNAIEPRGCLAYGVPAMDEWTLGQRHADPAHREGDAVRASCGIAESKLRVIAPDVGGGFGSKLNVYAEEALALALAKRSGRPVKWIEGRQENYVATIHGRGVTHDCTLAGDRGREDPRPEVRRARRHGRVLPAAHARASPSSAAGCTWARTRPRRTGTSSRGIVTNATPTDAYRGAGRPEATYVLERLVDAFARKIGKDPAEVRRMNFHPPFDEATHLDHAACSVD